MEEEAEKEWAEVKELAWKEKKEFVRIVKDNGFKWPHYLYWKYNDNGRAPSQFFNNMTLKKIIELFVFAGSRKLMKVSYLVAPNALKEVNLTFYKKYTIIYIES